MLYVGAGAATMQCGVSIYRLRNLHTGRVAINENLDNDSNYQAVMSAADVVGLIGVGAAVHGGVRASRQFSAATGRGVGSLFGARTQQFSRQQRRRLTESMGLQGGRRVPSRELNAVARRQLLDLIAAGVGLASSSSSGVIKEIGVWVISETDGQP